ncbi:MAG: hypothetical protein U0521_02600 [Anaerolineae bacterium]
MADLDALVDAVQSSAKYGSITPELIRRLGAEELRKHPRLRDAVKSTKNRLHQVAGAYLSAPPPYDGWLARLAAAQFGDERREVCRALMQTHASTRERLPILDEFYRTTLAGIAPVRSVLDIACGLNPLAIPFMPLADGAVYYACDIYADLADFLNRAFPLLGVTGGSVGIGRDPDRPRAVRRSGADRQGDPVLACRSTRASARACWMASTRSICWCRIPCKVWAGRRKGCAPPTTRSSVIWWRGGAGRSNASTSRPSWRT